MVVIGCVVGTIQGCDKGKEWGLLQTGILRCSEML